MDTDLAQQAITCALAGEWKKALELNKQILKETRNDVDALNRMARAYFNLGEIRNAKKIAEKVLKIDQFNSIAFKSLKKWKGLKASDVKPSIPSDETFLEEPGKTKILTLLHPGAQAVLAKLDSGSEVKLAPYSHRVSLVTDDGKYIGRLSDDIAARLRNLIRMGNRYKVLIKSIDEGGVKIFIRELSRGEKVTNVPSFSAEKIEYVSFTPPELVHKKDEDSLVEEEQEE